MPNETARPSRARAWTLSCAVVLGAAAITACSGGEAPSVERFCGEVEANKDALTNPQLAYSTDIEPLLALYRRIGALAPLGVSADWNHIVTAYETASTVVLENPESEQESLAAIYSAEKSAVAVENWLQANCAVDIGPVFTIVAHDPVAPTAPSDTTPTTGSTP